MWTKFRHKVVFCLLKPYFIIYLRIRYGFKAEKYNFGKGPALILFNHPTNFDPFMVSLSFKGPIHFMATDDIFSIPFVSSLIRYLVAPIPKSKSYKDIQAVKDCIRISREGSKISLSPEGNRNYTNKLNHINPAIVKLVRVLKVPLILYNIKGGFGVSPRFSVKLRRGKMIGEVKKELSVEEVKKLSDDELYSEIVTNLSVNDLTLNIKFKSKRKAEYLESLFYVCPVCEGLQTLTSKGDHVRCSKCGLDVEYTEDLKFKTSNPKFKFNIVHDWYKYQEDYITNLNVDENKVLFADDNVLLRHVVRSKKRTDLLTGKVMMDFEKIVVEKQELRYMFDLKTITSMTVLGHNKLGFYIDNDIYQIKGDKKFNAIKYMHLYFCLKNKRTGASHEQHLDRFLGI